MIGATGPAQCKADPTQPEDFWAYLKSMGGEWMWEDIDMSQWTAEDLTWILEGITQNTLIWTAGGSYDRKRAPLVSGKGWVIYCQATGKTFEVSSLK